MSLCVCVRRASARRLPNGLCGGREKRINVDYTQIDIFLFQKNAALVVVVVVAATTTSRRRVLSASLCLVSAAAVVVVLLLLLLSFD